MNSKEKKILAIKKMKADEYKKLCSKCDERHYYFMLCDFDEYRDRELQDQL